MGKLKLLIVDDSKVIRDRLKMMIHDLDCVEVIGEAEDYREAIMAISATDPDIIILDINMPGKSGLDVLHDAKLRPNPPIAIMMSNYSDIYYRELCGKLGADYFFDKSTEFDKIPEVLSAFVRI